MEKKIKVLYMITKGNLGGAQRYVFDLATHLPKEKFEVAVVVGEGKALEEKLTKAGVRTIRIGSLQRNVNPFKDIAVFFTIIRILRQERPDILHLNSSKIGGLGALAGRIMGTKEIIFTGHAWAFNEDRSIFSRTVIAFLHWLTILLCHTTIAVSERIKNQILLFPFSGKRIVRIYNGLENVTFLEKNAARKALLPDQTEKTWIGTISELHKNKGLDFLIKAFSSVSKDYENAILVIVGGGEERNSLEKQIKALGLENKVYLLGFKMDAAQFLKAFDIFTLTSRTESFPYAPLEAGLAGVPVVVSRVGGIPEVISNKENGMLVEPKNVFDIEYSLRELLQNPRKGAIMGEKLKKDVETKYQLDKMVEKTIELYRME